MMNCWISDDLFELRADIEAWQRNMFGFSLFTPFLRVGKGGVGVSIIYSQVKSIILGLKDMILIIEYCPIGLFLYFIIFFLAADDFDLIFLFAFKILSRNGSSMHINISDGRSEQDTADSHYLNKLVHGNHREQCYKYSKGHIVINFESTRKSLSTTLSIFNLLYMTMVLGAIISHCCWLCGVVVSVF